MSDYTLRLHKKRGGQIDSICTTDLTVSTLLLVISVFSNESSLLFMRQTGTFSSKAAEVDKTEEKKTTKTRHCLHVA
jgi:hypothetical protein